MEYDSKKDQDKENNDIKSFLLEYWIWIVYVITIVVLLWIYNTRG